MIEDMLANFELNEKQSSVYRAVLELGKCQVKAVAKRLQQPRTTVLGFIEELVKKGLLVREQISNNTFYSVASPQIFADLITQAKLDLSKKQSSADKLIEFITPFINKGKYRPSEIIFKEGKRNIELLLYKYEPLWRQSYQEQNVDTMWGYQDNTFVDAYHKWHEDSWSSRGGNENICLFSDKAGLAYQKKHKIADREIRLLPRNTELASSIWIHGGYVLIAQTRNEPHYAILIKDQALSDNLRVIFSLLWELCGAFNLKKAAR